MNDMASIAPHSIEAEQALLGAILINNEAYHAASSLIAAADFYEPLHARLFEVISSLIDAGKAATPITVNTYLPSDMDIAGMHPAVYLARLCAEATTIVNAVDYADTIREHARRRALIRLANDMMQTAYNQPVGTSAGSTAAEAISALDELLEHDGAARQSVSMADAAAEAIEQVARAYQRDVVGVSWGLRDLDMMTAGLHPGELVILAARPGMGKSAIALSVGYSAARAARGVAEFSLEMGRESLALRAMAAALAGDEIHVPYFAMRRGRIGAEQFERLTDAARATKDLPYTIDDQAGITLPELASKIRRAAKWMERRGKKLELVIIDYMQLINPGDRYRGNRVSEVTEISAGLKRIARDNRLAVLALSQLSRRCEEREDKRPQLSDLRESGSIEQDADTVLFLYREEYYLRQRKPPESEADRFGEWLAQMDAVKNRLEIIVAKQRHGPTDTVTAYFDPAVNVVRDLVECPRQNLFGEAM